MLHRSIKYIGIFLFLAMSRPTIAQERPKHVVVISIDGFRPEFYLDSSMPTPNLQELYADGVAAKEVTGIFPTVTYPSHTTLITGVTPKDHGIYYNTKIAKDGSAGNWVYDFAEIKSKTLWQAAKEKEMTTASVSWPISVDAQYIDYNIPEFWSFENPMDRRGATAEKANPKGLFQEVVANATGTLEINDYNLTSLSMDQNLARIAGYLLRKYKPNLLTVHLPSTDGAQHRQGREGNMVSKAIAGADNAVGIIRDALQKAGIGEETTIIITGDHGFVDVHTQIAPNVLLREHGLDQPKNGVPRAFFFSAGGSTFLHLRDHEDGKTLEQVKRLLAELPLEVRSTFEVVDADRIALRGGDSTVKLALTAKRGYSFVNGTKDGLMTFKKGGKHGYYPDFHDIATGFIGHGKGMQQGLVIENMYLEDVAKIVSALLQLDMDQGSQFYHSALNVERE